MDPQNFIQSLNNFHPDGQAFEFVEMDVDCEKKLIYLSEPNNEQIFNTKKHLTITQEIFIQIILLWIQCWQKKSHFALLYLDDKNWYNVLPSDTQQAMEEFIATHTKQKIIKK